MDAHFDRALNCEKTSQNDKGSLDGKLRDCNGEDNNDVKRLITYKNGNGRELTLARSLVKAPVRCMSTSASVRRRTATGKDWPLNITLHLIHITLFVFRKMCV